MSGIKKIKKGVNAVWAIKHMTKRAYEKMMKRLEKDRLHQMNDVVITIDSP